MGTQMTLYFSRAFHYRLHLVEKVHFMKGYREQVNITGVHAL